MLEYLFIIINIYIYIIYKRYTHKINLTIYTLTMYIIKLILSLN